MTTAKSLLAATAALAVIAATSACTANDPKPSPTTTSTTTSTTTTAVVTTAPTSLSPADQAAQDAERAIPSFWSVVDALSTDPSASLDKLAVVSREPSITTWRQLLTNHRVRQLTQLGRTTVASLTTKPGAAGTFAVTACIDVSKVNLVGKDGKSVVAATRPARVQYLYSVRKGSDGVFYVVEDKAVRTC